MINIIDDRTATQIISHSTLVVMTDSFLSGWGAARGGRSLAAWACTPDEVEACEVAVRARSDAKRVRIVDNAGNHYLPRGAKHLHIYVWRRR